MRQQRRWTRVLTRVLGGGMVLALVGAGVWWFTVRQTAAATTEAAPTTQTVAATLSTMEKSVVGSGTLTPTVQEEVSFEVSGTVTSVAVEAGQTVTAGQTLATVDTLQLTADLLSAKATLATAEASLADKQDADDGSDADEAQIAAAQAQVAVAEAAVEDATAAMAGATLVAPVGGLLTTVELAVGDVVTGSGSGASSGATPAVTGSTQATAPFVIVGTDTWEVEVSVDDADVALIATGDQAEITVSGVADLVFGTVTEIGLISTSTSGVAAFPVTIAVTGRPAGVHDGVSADVAIVYERRVGVLTVPAAAVRTVDGESVVTQAGTDGEEVSTVVTIGETDGTVTEILSGLVEGDEVLVTVVQQSGRSGTTDIEQEFPFPEGFTPGELPEGFDPSQMGGQMPGAPTNG